jgi:hypothetical protein
MQKLFREHDVTDKTSYNAGSMLRLTVSLETNLLDQHVSVFARADW